MKPIARLGALGLGLLAVTGLVGCTTEEPEGFGDGLGTSENPIPGDQTYRVVSRIQLGLQLPAVAAAVAKYRAFGAAPARTILATPAGVAFVNAVPSSLRSRLEGYLDVEIDKARVGTRTVRQFATEIATITQATLGVLAIESSLRITPTSATHTFTAINFTPSNLDIVVPIGGLKADTIAQTTTAIVSELGALELGEQKFGLALGSHAWQAINLASESLFGDDISVLTSALDCTAIAQTVAAKCSSGTCVGQASALATACTTFRDSLVADLRAGVTPVNLAVVRFAQGTAMLVDDSGDGIADQILDGTWDAEADVGTGLKKTTATFEALD